MRTAGHEVAGPRAGPTLGDGDRGRGVARQDEGFEAFARRERHALVAFAWSLTGDTGWAEDLAQDALEAAWQGWDRIGGYDKPGAWARRVVANRAMSRGRTTGREQRALGRVAARPPASVELEPADDRFWVAVRALPERQAQAVALHYLEDRGIGDIAEALGCAEGTVKVHLHRGRLALALGLLDKEGER